MILFQRIKKFRLDLTAGLPNFNSPRRSAIPPLLPLSAFSLLDFPPCQIPI